MTRTLLKQDAYCGLKKLGLSLYEISEFFYHVQEDPEEWKLYENTIQARIDKGEKRINQMGIVDDVRSTKETRLGYYKANNNWAPFYMRLFATKYPEHKDKFEFRKLKEAA